jgi:hypothetical protein
MPTWTPSFRTPPYILLDATPDGLIYKYSIISCVAAAVTLEFPELTDEKITFHAPGIDHLLALINRPPRAAHRLSCFLLN